MAGQENALRIRKRPGGKVAPGPAGSFPRPDLVIPRRVAPQQSPTPFHQTKTSIARGEENDGRDGCIGPSSLEEEALAAQSQPAQPSGPADSAGVSLNEAACVRGMVAL